ncbi:phosphohistidine phosphatase [Glaciecola punicea ACAM 611]|uniref:Phosphohistidine phosphatase n=1 Tax=Glaciecola punicea ACAM 611 TaxID=1121923 RepID=H5TBI2_9ALTE|nr:phosphohistidine phosphatase SixA [Glaciecola punicea]OFA30968.1 phosphohistidine phosphatase SixA [Glaciecola punicea]GAB55659.1 phosphohistidine phosphatase [Glaciecola punicea ACAM 611]
MLLIIMRHGEAVEYAKPDRARSLTNVGVQQSENVGRWLNQHLAGISTYSEITDVMKAGNTNVKSSIDLALVSPYFRTQQTFRGVAKHIKVLNEKTTDALTPIASAQQSADVIHDYATSTDAPKSMLIVTHMPLVSLLSRLLCVNINDQYFEPADTLLIDYKGSTAIGKKLAMFQGV